MPVVGRAELATSFVSLKLSIFLAEVQGGAEVSGASLKFASASPTMKLMSFLTRLVGYGAAALLWGCVSPPPGGAMVEDLRDAEPETDGGTADLADAGSDGFSVADMGGEDFDGKDVSDADADVRVEMGVPACDDGVHNGTETGTDCGGDCAACPNDEACARDGDCLSMNCLERVCREPSCDDGRRNGDETDMDCGGACPTGCGTGSPCGVAGDCVSLICAGSLCELPRSCADAVQKGASVGDGDYLIDVDGLGPAQPLTVYCDMTTDGRVGYTMLRIDDAALVAGDGTQPAYRQKCADLGMEVIVPRSRAHATSIIAYNGGEPPNVVNVFPKAAGAVGLGEFQGICQGQPCRFWMSDVPSASCPRQEPNGDNAVDQALYRTKGIESGCPFGSWNDNTSQHMVFEGYVVCSTNDAGPPAFGSCLEILDADAVQNTRYGSINGEYEIIPSGQTTPLEVFCDMFYDGGGYTYYKVEVAAPVSAAQAETECTALGMRLFIPRTELNLQSALWAAVQTDLGPSGGADYLKIMGVYPKAVGSVCNLRPFHSGNATCEFRAGDDGAFFITNASTFFEPDGTQGDTASSLDYRFDLTTGAVNFIDDLAAPGALSNRFICMVGDK